MFTVSYYAVKDMSLYSKILRYSSMMRCEVDDYLAALEGSLSFKLKSFDEYEGKVCYKEDLRAFFKDKGYKLTYFLRDKECMGKLITLSSYAKKLGITLRDMLLSSANSLICDEFVCDKVITNPEEEGYYTTPFDNQLLGIIAIHPKSEITVAYQNTLKNTRDWNPLVSTFIRLCAQIGYRPSELLSLYESGNGFHMEEREPIHLAPFSYKSYQDEIKAIHNGAGTAVIGKTVGRGTVRAYSEIFHNEDRVPTILTLKAYLATTKITFSELLKRLGY